MSKKLISTIVAAGLAYSSRLLAQGEAVESAGNLPEGLTEFGVLSDSETWNKLVGVEKREDGTYLKLNERLAVKTTRGYNRNFGLEDVMVFVQDTDPVDKRKDPEKKDYRYLRGPTLTSRLPDWLSDGSFRVYLLSGRGQISARHPGKVYRLDEHYELPVPSGVLQFGAVAAGGGTTQSAEKPKQEEPKKEVKKQEVKPAEVPKVVKPADAARKETPKVAARPTKKESAAKGLFRKLIGSYNLELGFANTDVASPNTDSSMSGLSGGVGAVVVYPYRAWTFGGFADSYRRGFDTENTYGKSLGSKNNFTNFAVGAAGSVIVENNKRNDLWLKALFGYLGHRGKNDFDGLSFRESGNGLVLEGLVYLPKLFKHNNKYYWGLKDEFSLEALSLKQSENSHDFKSRYGWKTRGSNKLLTAFVTGRTRAEVGWQLDSAYSLTPVSNTPFNTIENSVGVETMGNLYGNQVVGNISYGSRRFASFGLVLPFSAEGVRREAAEIRFGNLLYVLSLKYENVEAEGVRDKRVLLSLNFGRSLAHRQRINYPGLR